jgi:hypothetical protein
MKLKNIIIMLILTVICAASAIGEISAKYNKNGIISQDYFWINATENIVFSINGTQQYFRNHVEVCQDNTCPFSCTNESCINEALEYAMSLNTVSGNTTVIIKRGRYEIYNTIRIPDRCTLQGEGRGAVHLRLADNATGNLIENYDRDVVNVYIGIKDLRLFGRKYAQNNNSISGIDLQHVARSTIEGVSSTYFPFAALIINGTLAVQSGVNFIRDSEFRHSYYGIFMGRHTDDSLIYSNDIGDNYIGIYFNLTGFNKVNGNGIYLNNIGILLENAPLNIIGLNEFNVHGNSTIIIGNTSHTTTVIGNTFVSQCKNLSNTYSIIEIWSNNNAIIGNTGSSLTNCLYTVWERGNSNFNAITANAFTKCTGLNCIKRVGSYSRIIGNIGESDFDPYFEENVNKYIKEVSKEGLLFSTNFNNNSIKNDIVLDGSGNNINTSWLNGTNSIWNDKIGLDNSGTFEFNNRTNSTGLNLGWDLSIPKYNAFSISLWAKTKRTNDRMDIVSKMGTGINELTLRIDNDNKLYFTLWTAAGGVVCSAKYEQGISPNIWYHIVGVYVNNSNCTLYLNGTSVANSTVSSEMNINKANFVIGGHPNNFNGTIDNLEIYNRELLSDEVKLIYLKRIEPDNPFISSKIGYTGTCGAATTLTVSGGVITGCS